MYNINNIHPFWNSCTEVNHIGDQIFKMKRYFYSKLYYEERASLNLERNRLKRKTLTTRAIHYFQPE